MQTTAQLELDLVIAAASPLTRQERAFLMKFMLISPLVGWCSGESGLHRQGHDISRRWHPCRCDLIRVVPFYGSCFIDVHRADEHAERPGSSPNTDDGNGNLSAFFEGQLQRRK
uniref:hypothetical protein n=1 Tax=Hylemonella sp. TaxID=2066020 RepID=UPI0035B37DFD